MDRPTTTNADEWQLWLVECGVKSSLAPFIAVQICEALEAEEEKCNLRINHILDNVGS